MKYQEPSIEICEMELSDVVTLSGGTGSIGGGLGEEFERQTEG